MMVTTIGHPGTKRQENKQLQKNPGWRLINVVGPIQPLKTLCIMPIISGHNLKMFHVRVPVPVGSDCIFL